MPVDQAHPPIGIRRHIIAATCAVAAFLVTMFAVAVSVEYYSPVRQSTTEQNYTLLLKTAYIRFLVFTCNLIATLTMWVLMPLYYVLLFCIELLLWVLTEFLHLWFVFTLKIPGDNMVSYGDEALIYMHKRLFYDCKVPVSIKQTVECSIEPAMNTTGEDLYLTECFKTSSCHIVADAYNVMPERTTFSALSSYLLMRITLASVTSARYGIAKLALYQTLRMYTEFACLIGSEWACKQLTTAQEWNDLFNKKL